MSRRGLVRGQPVAHTAPTTAASTVNFAPSATVGGTAAVAGASAVGFTAASGLAGTAEVAGDAPVGFALSATVFVDPTSISGLVIDYNPADVASITKDGSDRISQWNNTVTGVSNDDLLQATGGNQPLYVASFANLNGQPGVTFAKARSDHMATGTLGTAVPNPATWFVVAYHESHNTNGGIFIDGAGASNRNQIAVNNVNALSGYSGAILSGGTVTAPATARAIALVTGTSGKIYHNALTAKNSGTTGTQTLTQLRVGAEQALSAGYYLDGTIGRILCYNRALSQTEIGQILTWAGAVFAISIGA